MCAECHHHRASPRAQLACAHDGRRASRRPWSSKRVREGEGEGGKPPRSENMSLKPNQRRPLYPGAPRSHDAAGTSGAHRCVLRTHRQVAYCTITVCLSSSRGARRVFTERFTTQLSGRQHSHGSARQTMCTQLPPVYAEHARTNTNPSSSSRCWARLRTKLPAAAHPACVQRASPRQDSRMSMACARRRTRKDPIVILFAVTIVCFFFGGAIQIDLILVRQRDSMRAVLRTRTTASVDYGFDRASIIAVGQIPLVHV